MNNAELRIHEIASCLYGAMKDKSHNVIQGLFDGDFGVLLFLFYYTDFTKERKYTQLAKQVLNRLLIQLESNFAGFSYSQGYAGIFYLFHFLQEKKFIRLDFSDSEKLLENFLIKLARACMSLNDYDYLNGSLGVALYFLKKNPNHPFICEFIEFIYQKAEKDSLNHTVKWKTPYGWPEREYGYHLSLSHGMTSMVLFLCRLIKSKSINSSNDCLTMLEGCMNYILLQGIDHKCYGSYFPNRSLEDNHSPLKSRLAWCFGDVGIAWALWQTGSLVENQQWQNKAIEIMKYAAQRVSSEQTWVNDCGLCHGSAGIAMMFRRFYLETNEKNFHDAWSYWIDFTLNFKRFDNGLAGFKTFELGEWKNDLSLLTGISGIGMTLLSFIRNDLQEWDELFLIS